MAPARAIAEILAAYDQAGGYPDGAARLLKIHKRNLHRWNRRLGIVHLIRQRTGHKPGWQGSNAWIWDRLV